MSPIAARKKTIIWMIAAIVLAVSSIALGAGLIVSHNSLTDTRNQLTDRSEARPLADTESNLSAADASHWLTSHPRGHADHAGLLPPP